MSKIRRLRIGQKGFGLKLKNSNDHYQNKDGPGGMEFNSLDAALDQLNRKTVQYTKVDPRTAKSSWSNFFIW